MKINSLGTKKAVLGFSDRTAFLSLYFHIVPFIILTQNEITEEDAKIFIQNGVKYVCEGSNMASTNEAIQTMLEGGIILGPSKAANAGGVACSCIEMGQNSGHTSFTAEQVYEQLHCIMKCIHQGCADASMEVYGTYNLVAGANIAGFKKVAEAMLAQGIV